MWKHFVRTLICCFSHKKKQVGFNKDEMCNFDIGDTCSFILMIINIDDDDVVWQCTFNKNMTGD